MDLTQVYCCRCNATTTVPATTSMFDADGDGVLDVAGERPLFPYQVTCTVMSIHSAPRHDDDSTKAGDNAGRRASEARDEDNDER